MTPAAACQKARLWVEPAETGPAVAELVAGLTRAAHRAPGLADRLPVPDGAGDTAAAVAATLAGGGQAWLVRAGRGEVVGAGQVTRPASGAWRVRRVSVRPDWRQHGVARALIRGIESAAADSGASEVVLDAVVERRLAAFYARLGYRVVSHWPSPDKLLTEVTMRRCPAESPHRYEGPGAGDEALPASGVVVCWWAVPGGGSVRLAGPVPDPVGVASVDPGPPGGRLVGVDVWPGGTADHRAGLREGLRDRHRLLAEGELLSLPVNPARCPGYRQPRLLDPRLLAWWRPLAAGPAGREEGPR